MHLSVHLSGKAKKKKLYIKSWDWKKKVIRIIFTFSIVTVAAQYGVSDMPDVLTY